MLYIYIKISLWNSENVGFLDFRKLFSVIDTVVCLFVCLGVIVIREFFSIETSSSSVKSYTYSACIPMQTLDRTLISCMRDECFTTTRHCGGVFDTYFRCGRDINRLIKTIQCFYRYVFRQRLRSRRSCKI